MKPVIELFLAASWISSSGCATYYVTEWRAKPHVERDQDAARDVHVDGQPAYYALLPFTIPFDMATAPLQAMVLSAWWPAPRTE